LHINPVVYGEGDIYTSIVSYLFARFFNPHNIDLVDLALVGAVGDAQDEEEGFREMVRKFISDEELSNKVSVTTGIKVYGYNTRPIFKALAYTFNPFIPGISGSESSSVQFLADVGISPVEGEEWKKMSDLTLEEQKKLASALVLERLNLPEEADRIFGDIYTFIGKPVELQDAREFSTLINACSRTGDFETALRICFGDLSILEKSKEILGEYRKMLSDALTFVRESGFIHKKNANFLVAGKKINDSIIGTVISIALHSNLVDQSKPVFGLADVDDKTIKVSARATGNVNLAEIVTKSSKAVGGYGGGHKNAAGAFIPKTKEKEFIDTVDNLLGE
jgi:RecJ-like exonuclease